MGKKKTKYDSMLEELRDKVQKAGGSRYSKSDRTAVTHGLLNQPDQEVEVYLKDCPDPAITKPVEHFREELKSVVKQFGVDNAELEKVQEIECSKGFAEAFNEVSDVATKDYLSTGRKLIFPVTSESESQMELSQVEKPAKAEDTRKLVETSPGKFESVPTGERKKTKAHTEIKASNKIPGWLVEKEKI